MRKDKGITLVTLVVTIIVLLILAGVTISMVVGNDGILKKAQQAKLATQESNEKELSALQQLEDELTLRNYVKEGLMLHYDAINNTGNGHDDKATVWKDLSGNGNDGTLYNFSYDDTNGWNNRGLQFNGNKYVTLKEMNYPNVTIQAVFKLDEITNQSEVIIANFEDGGYGITYTGNQKFCFAVFVNNKGYVNLMPNYPMQNVEFNKTYTVSGSYDGIKVSYLSNYGKYEYPIEGTIKYPATNTIMMLGSNPYGDRAGGEYLHGTIYSIRIYNRALTEEEILQNYNTDKERFHLE